MRISSNSGQRGHNTRTFSNSSSMDTNGSGVAQMKKMELKMKGQDQIEKSGSGTVSTIGAVSTVTGQMIQLPLELLSMILQNFKSRRDIYNFRRVNSVWRALTRSRVIGWNHEIRVTESGPLSPKFISLIQFLRVSSDFGCLDQFPSTRVKMTGTNLDFAVAQNFFDLYGPFIKTLTLENCTSHAEKDGKAANLAKLLTQQAPNIEELSIQSFNILSPEKNYDGPIFLFSNKSPSSPNGIKLPALKRLAANFRRDEKNEIVKEILEAADNLEDYGIDKHVDETVMDKLVSLNKIYTVKRQDFNLAHRRKFCEYFANLKM